MGKKSTLLLFLLLITVFYWTGNASAAGHRFHIQVQSGLNGHAKEGRGFPVTVSIQNQGKDFSGDLVVVLPDANGEYKRIFPVHLAADAKKNISFSVQNYNPYIYNRNQSGQISQKIYLYEGNWKNGRRMNINPKLKIQPNQVSNNLTIGILSRNPDALNAFRFVNNADLIKLDQNTMPKDATGLDPLDKLVIDDYPISAMPIKEQNAIVHWVYEGGQLIIGSEPGMKQQIGSLAHLIPFSVNGEKTIHSYPQFKNWGKVKFKASSLKIMTGKADMNAKVIARHGHVPLLLKKNIGLGSITQFTFQLSNAKLTNWKGFVSFLNATAGKNVPQSSNSQVANQDHPFVQISKLFDSISNLPLVSVLVLLMGYVIIAVPIIYVLLKKLDRREWNWIVIPAFAVVFSLGLFLFGAKDRLGAIKTNAVSAVFVDDNGVGTGKGAVSMLSKTSGDYTMSVYGGPSGHPLPGNNIQGGLSQYPAVIQSGTHNEYHFQNVAFWSPQSSVYQLPVKNYGGFHVQLNYENGKLTGTIKNRSQYDFFDIRLLSGTNKINIGQLKAGEKVSVSINAGAVLQAPSIAIHRTFYPGNPQGSSQHGLQAKKQNLLNNAGLEGMLNGNNPVLMGYTKSSLFKVDVNGKKTNQSGLSLFVEPVQVHLKDSHLSFNTTLKTPDVSTSDGNVSKIPSGQGNEAVELSKGTYRIQYAIPPSITGLPYNLRKLTVIFKQKGAGTYEIYDASSRKYVPLQRQMKFTFANHPDHFVNQGTIQIRLKQPSSNHAVLPDVIIKGVTNND